MPGRARASASTGLLLLRLSPSAAPVLLTAPDCFPGPRGAPASDEDHLAHSLSILRGASNTLLGATPSLPPLPPALAALLGSLLLGSLLLGSLEVD